MGLWSAVSSSGHRQLIHFRLLGKLTNAFLKDHGLCYHLPVQTHSTKFARTPWTAILQFPYAFCDKISPLGIYAVVFEINQQCKRRIAIYKYIDNKFLQKSSADYFATAMPVVKNVDLITTKTRICDTSSRRKKYQHRRLVKSFINRGHRNAISDVSIQPLFDRQTC